MPDFARTAHPRRALLSGLATACALGALATPAAAAWNESVARGGDTDRVTVGGAAAVRMVTGTDAGERAQIRNTTGRRAKPRVTAQIRLDSFDLNLGGRRALISVYGPGRASYRAGVVRNRAGLRWAVWSTGRGGKIHSLKTGPAVRKGRWNTVTLATGWRTRTGKGTLVVNGRRIQTKAINRRSARSRVVLLGLDAGRRVRGRAQIHVRRQAVRGPGATKPKPKPRPIPTPSGGSRLFSPNSVWNKPLARNAAIDPSSGRRVAELRRQVRQHDAWINTNKWSTRLYVVGKNHPRQQVSITQGCCDDLKAASRRVPVPANARAAAGSDAHITIYQPSTNTLWEYFRFGGSNGNWNANYGGVIRNVSRSNGVVANHGASASSLPIIGGTITIAEAKRKVIPHALAMAVPEQFPGHVAPAKRTDRNPSVPGGVPENAQIPMGSRFRLPASLNIDAQPWPELTKAMARAAQRYGIIVRDKSGSVTFYGEAPKSGDPWKSIYGGRQPSYFVDRFPWDKLQLVKMGPITRRN